VVANNRAPQGIESKYSGGSWVWLGNGKQTVASHGNLATFYSPVHETMIHTMPPQLQTATPQADPPKPATKPLPLQTEADQDQPTTFQLVQIALALASLPGHLGETYVEMHEEALQFWRTAQAVQKAQLEKHILLESAKKMWDDENWFAGAEYGQSKAARGRRRIPHDQWLIRLIDYPGDKYELLFDLVQADEVPKETLLKELFHRADSSRETQLQEMLQLAWPGWFATRLRQIAKLLTASCPQAERQDLLAALDTFELHKIRSWLHTNKIKDPLDQYPAYDLIRAAENDCANYFCEGGCDTVPLIVCQTLLLMRQQQLARGRTRGSGSPTIATGGCENANVLETKPVNGAPLPTASASPDSHRRQMQPDRPGDDPRPSVPTKESRAGKLTTEKLRLPRSRGKSRTRPGQTLRSRESPSQV